MAIRRWWDGDSSERYWMEITEREDIGADLHAPKVDGSGREYWSYSLVTEVEDGDIVLHWWKRGEGAEPALVGWSQAIAPVLTSQITWQARGTVGRTRGAPITQQSWRLPLTGFTEFSPSITLTDLRAVEPGLRQVQHELAARHGGSLYFPFAFSDKRPMRTTQGYLVKFPAGLVRAIPALAGTFGGSNETAPPATATQRPTQRDRRINDTALRRAIEMHAVDQTIEHLQRLGWTAEHVGTTRPYDIAATKDGEELRLEVKGSITKCVTVELTDGEVNHARQHKATSLAVVDGITWTMQDDGTITTAGGRTRLWANWIPDQDSLVPIRLRYLLPADPPKELTDSPYEGTSEGAAQ